MKTMVRDLSLDAYPHLVEHVAYHLRPASGDRTSAFDFGLDLILDGLEPARGSI